MINLFGANGYITQFFGGSVNKREELEQLIKERMEEASNQASGSATSSTASTNNVLVIVGVALIATVLIRR